MLGAIVGVLVAALSSLGLWWALHRAPQTNDAVAPPPTAPTQAQPPSATSPAAASPSPQASSAGTVTQSTDRPPNPSAEQVQQSLAALQAARDSSRQQVTLDGRWAAQLASKYDGVVDPLQRTAAGSHTFGYPDILTEFEQLRAAYGNAVIMLNATDFGRQVESPKPYWISLYDGGFTTSAQAQAWCEQQFPGTTGKALANTCLPRSLPAPFSRRADGPPVRR